METGSNILFLARSLGQGGAERQLIELAKGLARKGYPVQVLVFYGRGDLEQELLEAGIGVRNLNKTGRWDMIIFLIRLYQTVRKYKPKILHSYLGTANSLAILLKPFLPHTQIVWGVRASNMDLEEYGWVARWSYQIESWLSPFADLIICNSEAGRIHAVAKGFPAKKISVIPNGIDIERFKPDPVARLCCRTEWGIKAKEVLIGLIGRLDPMKDHPTFIRAAAKYAAAHSNARFVCVGDGPDDYRRKLQQMSANLGLQEKLIWVGGRNDMPTVYNALDLLTSSSAYGEGFSNAIGEAMASGIPCVVTDVGDSAKIVAETGVVIAPRKEDALVAAWENFDWQKKQRLGQLARARICKYFSGNSLIENTEIVLFDKASASSFQRFQSVN
jgi:glycosyltransferase involved in cell wall biosynthesis